MRLTKRFLLAIAIVSLLTAGQTFKKQPVGVIDIVQPKEFLRLILYALIAALPRQTPLNPAS